MSIQRRALRRTRGEMQDQIDQLSKLTYESIKALGESHDVLARRVVVLEDALARAQSKAAGHSGIILPTPPKIMP